MKNLRNIAIAVVAVIGLLYMTSTEGTKTNTDNNVQLNASFEKSFSTLFVTNNDSYNYLNAKVQINGEYEVKCPIIVPGQKVTIALNEFTNSSGQRFDPNSNTVTKAFIYYNNNATSYASLGRFK